MRAITTEDTNQTEAAYTMLAGLLTQMQFLRPHAACLTVLTRAADQVGLCGQPAVRVLQRLDLTPSTAVGRLSRSQLLQLANTFYRFARRLPAPERSQTDRKEAIICQA